MKISTNLAISADGKLSPSREVAGAFTGDEDSQRFHELRIDCDALLVGRGTLEADQMTMLVGNREPQDQPLRCVISRSGKFDFDHKLFQTPGGPIHLIVTGDDLPSHLTKELPNHATLHHCPLAEFLDWLQQQGVSKLHCEGGGGVIHELASLERIDEFNLTLAAHHLFGGWQAPTPTGDSTSPYLPKSLQFSLARHQTTPNGELIATYVAH